MGSATTLRFRRSAAQLHALAQLEREIRATDPHTRRKYLRDFRTAFHNYEALLQPAQLAAMYRAADVLLVGDYHALPRSQQFAAELLAQLAAERPVVLGLEMVFSRDQDILDSWWRGDFEEAELREHLRFDLDWGYDWAPFYGLLAAARQHAAGVYGLDCTPRGDLRRIALRDRHAAEKIGEIRERHPQAALVVLFGESHLAPDHLPGLLRAQRAQDRLLTVLQNVDSLYWRAAGERYARVEAVRVSSDVVCVFNSTPLEKYESYRLCLERWRQERATAPDLAPSFYNMVDALLRFLNINKYAAPNGYAASTGPLRASPLVDQFPEVCFQPDEERTRRLLLRKISNESEVKEVLARLEEQGCCYVPQARAVLVRNFDLAQGAEEAAHFLHYVCRGALPAAPAREEDRFYTRVLEYALSYFGSRALYPARPVVREFDLYNLYALPREAVEQMGLGSYREVMQVVDFLALHKDYEANLRHYRELPEMLTEGVRYEGEKLHYATRQLGYMLGSELYDAYISGRVAKRFLRSLFFRPLHKPGTARTIYFATQRRLRRRKRAQSS